MQISILIDELAYVKNQLKILKEKEEGLKELILFELGSSEQAESDLYVVNKKIRYSYCWKDEILGYLRDRNIIEHFVVFTDTKIKELVKNKQISVADKLEIDRNKYIAEEKEIIKLEAKKLK